MSKEQYAQLESRHDGLQLSLMWVEPEGAPRAVVQLAHGMCEHKGRYLPFMEYLAERGCACVINDHRGHGHSVRAPEDLGYFYRDGDVGLVDDLHQITQWARERWPGVPLILFGHSMGSLAVRAYCQDYDRDIDGLVVCGSPGENPASGVGLALIWLLSRVKGERYRSELIRGMTTGSFEKRAKRISPDGSWLSANVNNANSFARDPLCGFNFTLNGYRALLRLMRRAYGLHGTRGNAGMPVHFYSGEDDPCAPNREGFERAMESMRKAGYRNVTGYMFPGLRHEILNESKRGEVYGRIADEVIGPAR